MSIEQLSEAKAGGLTDEEIEYLRKPARAVEYSARHSISMDAVQKLISSGKLRAVLCKDVLWVQDLSVDVSMDATSVTDFFEKLWQGNLGLAMIYWVYGVLAGTVWAVAIISLQPEQESDLARLVVILMVAYYFVVYVGIWRAATKYKGNKLWEILAKFVVIVTVLPIIIRFLK